MVISVIDTAIAYQRPLYYRLLGERCLATGVYGTEELYFMSSLLSSLKA